ncbi:MAG: Postacrosomal sheath domain-binding protein [Acidimicrobiales bacterium]|nr:Postacrosomal sheath domain-binding protein [Acidimicrobiales bacterium]
MSDVSQGPGWWQASDGKWYPPESATPTAPPFAAPTAPPAGPPPGFGAPVGAPLGGPPAYGAPAGAPGQLAEWGTRVSATLIDGAIFFAGYIAVFILALIFGAIADALALLVLLVGYLALAAASLYFAYLTGETGQSPGKRIIGIKVISEQTGQPIGGGMGIARSFVHFIDGICMIGYLSPLWDAKKQTFTDKVLNTVVVTGVPKQSFGPDLFKR